MSHVWKSPNSKNWIARFTDKDGKRRNRSTGTTDRKKAEKIAEGFEDVAKGKLTVRQIRSVLAELSKEIIGESLERVSVADCAKRFLSTKKPEVSENTLRFYSDILDKWQGHLGRRADSEVAEITREHVLAFRSELSAKLAPKTVNHYVKVLRMFFASAKRDGIIAEDPTEYVETVRNRQEKTRRPFTLPELRSVLDHADEEWQSMIRFGLYTGQRLGDIARLTWANIDTRRGEIRLQTRKTGKALLLPMSPALLRHIATLPASDEPSAPIHPRALEIVNRQRTSGNLSNQFADILAAAGLREKTTHRKGAGRGLHALSFHSLRHTATSLLREAGVAPALARAFIGHDSAEMHEQYVGVSNEALQKVADALPEI